MDITEKYFVKTNNKPNNPGEWDSLGVDIFLKDGETEVKIGEYNRNYHSLFNTFCPFELDGNEYALYSKDYTATRVMSLPDCKDLGGEESDGYGFCPTDFYVPEICIEWPPESDDDPQPIFPQHNPEWQARIQYDGGTRYYYPSDKENPEGYSEERHLAYKAEQERIKPLSDAWHLRHPFTVMTAPFGFVAGCIWGDDSSWKIQYLDLSQVSDGIIKRDDRFGYIELPGGCQLKDVIYTGALNSRDDGYVVIGVAKTFNLKTGKVHGE